MGKKETLEKLTTTQFLMVQLHHRRGKEIEQRFNTIREQGRILALLKMADAQDIDGMSMVLGMDAKELKSLVMQLKFQGLVEVETPEPEEQDAFAEDVEAVEIAEASEAAEDEEPVADEAAESVDDSVDVEGAAEEAADGSGAEEVAETEGEAEAEPAADKPEAAAKGMPMTVRITEAGRTWEQPATDYAGLLLAGFSDEELEVFDANLDKFVAALEGECGASASELMEEERKRREDAASHREKGPRDGDRRSGRDRGDRGDRGGRGRGDWHGRDDRGGRGDRRGSDRGDRGGFGGGKGGYRDRSFGKGRRGGFDGGRGRDEGGRGGFGGKRDFGRGRGDR